MPSFEDQSDLDQESKDLIDGSLSYISCWLKGMEYSPCTKRCTQSHAQQWLAEGSQDAATQNRQFLKSYANDPRAEAAANSFGYTFKVGEWVGG